MNSWDQGILFSVLRTQSSPFSTWKSIKDNLLKVWTLEFYNWVHSMISWLYKFWDLFSRMEDMQLFLCLLFHPFIVSLVLMMLMFFWRSLKIRTKKLRKVECLVVQILSFVFAIQRLTIGLQKFYGPMGTVSYCLRFQMKMRELLITCSVRTKLLNSPKKLTYPYKNLTKSQTTPLISV